MSNTPAQQPRMSIKSPRQTQLKGRDIAIDYLRSFVIILVVFHHAALAYTSFSTFNETRYVDSTAPVVDAIRWPLLDPFVTFNDTFFMALLFLVSGLFTISSLERKGSKDFFIARLKRLGIPFVVASLSIIPLAYWPSNLLAAPGQQTTYWITFFTSDGWPSGPLWFLWVLLAFSGIVALIHRVAPTMLAKLRRQPTGLVIFMGTIVSYLPLSLLASPYSWVSLGGPFDVQTSRIALYFAYFLLGMAFGTGQQWRKEGWPKHWGSWFLFGILSFFAYMWLLVNDANSLPVPVHQVMLSVTFAASCTGTSLGFLGAFRRFVHTPHRISDNLSTNAYGIYILHYVFITWIQFALLSISMPAWTKFGIAFIGSFILTWGVGQLVRQIPTVRRVL